MISSPKMHGVHSRALALGPGAGPGELFSLPSALGYAAAGAAAARGLRTGSAGTSGLDGGGSRRLCMGARASRALSLIDEREHGSSAWR